VISGWIEPVGYVISIVTRLTLGTVAAYAITKVIGSLLVGVSTHDPATFVVALVSMLIASACAVLVPGMRVLRLNPADILREG
jgi:ABC-type antimicrobial peptide transport system permease subunit